MHTHVCKFIRIILISVQADLEMINDAGHTSLHLAIAHNHPNVVRVLLSRGADSGNVSMPMMRLWSPTNITTRIDDLLKQFPARKKIKPIDSSIDLSQEELKKLKQSFDYLDQEGTGYIGLKELQRFISLEGASLSRALVLASSSFEGGRAKNLVSFQDFVNVLYGGTRGRTKKRQAKQRSVNHHNTLENLQDQRQRLLTGNRAASPRYTGDDATPADDDDVEETDVAGIGSNHNGGETKRVYKSKFMRFTM